MSTKIEWTNETWNPVTGCTKVSQGCKNCYAERLAPKVFAGQQVVMHNSRPPGQRRPRLFTDVWTHPGRLDAPLHWKRPRRIFVNSMSDLFHEDVPDGFIAAVFGIMHACPQHTFQILTKRPERFERFFAWLDIAPIGRAQIMHEAVKGQLGYNRARRPAINVGPWPLPNVWLGVSVEDQATADERIPLLLQTPAAVRFLSCEPLLGPVSLERPIPNDDAYRERIYLDELHWVIAGGESGQKARPSHPDWFRSLRDQCAAAGVPFFFKQWGAWEEVASDWRDDDGNHHEVNVPSADADDWFVDGDNRNCLLAPDGTAYYYMEKIPADVPCRLMNRVGKKAAGRLLDGREHSEFPA